jgi:hypothetical protein
MPSWLHDLGSLTLRYLLAAASAAPWAAVAGALHASGRGSSAIRIAAVAAGFATAATVWHMMERSSARRRVDAPTAIRVLPLEATTAAPPRSHWLFYYVSANAASSGQGDYEAAIERLGRLRATVVLNLAACSFLPDLRDAAPRGTPVVPASAIRSNRQHLVS